LAAAAPPTPLGGFSFDTIKPGGGAGPRRQAAGAAHSAGRFSRAACCCNLYTRIYFDDETDSKRRRPGVGTLVPAERRADADRAQARTPAGAAYRFVSISRATTRRRYSFDI